MMKLGDSETPSTKKWPNQIHDNGNGTGADPLAMKDGCTKMLWGEVDCQGSLALSTAATVAETGTGFQKGVSCINSDR